MVFCVRVENRDGNWVDSASSCDVKEGRDWQTNCRCLAAVCLGSARTQFRVQASAGRLGMSSLRAVVTPAGSMIDCTWRGSSTIAAYHSAIGEGDGTVLPWSWIVAMLSIVGARLFLPVHLVKTGGDGAGAPKRAEFLDPFGEEFFGNDRCIPPLQWPKG